MGYPVTLNGRTYTLADFEGNNYVDGLPDAFEDFVTHAGDIYNDTSTTSNSIGTGSKTFTVTAGKPYQAGTPLRIADAAAPATNFLDAVVTSYSGTTLVVEVVGYAGSGTKTSWTVNIGGAKTVDGTLGVAQGGTGATTASDARDNLGLGTTDSPTFAGLTVTGTTSFSDISISDVGDIAVDSVSGDADPDTKITFAGSNVLNIEAGGSTVQSVTTSGIGVTGNITVSGTVDGRDIAADGTKIDGIEASADVTDTANVTAAGALMDSELTNIAAVKALDQGVATTDTPTFAGINNTESRPTIRPALMFDFANSKAIDPRATFSRGTTATYWDGKTTVKAEENLIPNSQNFDGSGWSATDGTLTDDAATAPDGTTTAGQFTINTGGGAHYIQSDFVLSPSVQFTLSFYVKANGYDYIYSRLGVVGDKGAVFNLATASVHSTTSNTTATIVDAGNGWYRCTYTSTSNSSTQADLYIFPSDNTTVAADGNPSVTGDGSSGFYIWGVQCERRGEASAYLETGSSVPLIKFQPVLQTAAAEVARFDHDPIDKECKGLLIEEGRTNLILQSENFGSGTWTKVGLRKFYDAAIAPDGTQTADWIQHSNAAQTHYFYQTVSVTSGEDYIYSGYVKKPPYGSSNDVRFFWDTGDINIDFTGDDPVFTGATGYEHVGNGWWRFWKVFTASVSSLNTFTYASQNRILDTGFMFWGLQLESRDGSYAGDYPSSYIKTTSAQVTRGSESFRIDLDDVYQGGDVTIYTEASGLGDTDYTRLVLLSDNTNYNRIQIVESESSNIIQAFVNTINSTQANVGVSFDPAENAFYKTAMAVSQDDVAISANGLAPATETTVNLPAGINRMWLGSLNSAVPDSGARFKKVALYSARLSNATLQAMTEE
jgi:hypothetical protein